MQKKNLFQELFFSNKNFVWHKNFFIMEKKIKGVVKKCPQKKNCLQF